MYGPIDYVVVGFKGNHFDGSIVSELSQAVNSGVIRVLDLLFIKKGADGTVVGGEYIDQSDEMKKSFKKLGFAGYISLLTEKDIEKVGESMEKNSAAGVLVIEHVWAKGLKKAIISADGYLIAEGRIHPESIVAALDELKSEQVRNSDTTQIRTKMKGDYAHVG